MGKKNYAKNKRKQEEVVVCKWEDLVSARDAIVDKVTEAFTTVHSILQTLSKEVTPELELEKKEDIKELSSIISGFTKSIDDIDLEAKGIADNHGTAFFKIVRDENGNEILDENSEPIRELHYDFLKGEIDKEDVAGFLKYNELLQRYIKLEYMAYELYSKTIPDLFIRVSTILNKTDIVDDIKAEREKFLKFANVLEGTIGDITKFFGNNPANLGPQNAITVDIPSDIMDKAKELEQTPCEAPIEGIKLEDENKKS